MSENPEASAASQKSATIAEANADKLLSQAEETIARGDFAHARRLFAQLQASENAANEVDAERLARIKKTLSIDSAQIFVVALSLAFFLWAVWRYWLHS